MNDNNIKESEIAVFSDVLNYLVLAQTQLDHEDYCEIFGERLGEHIWFQDAPDIVNVWKSGLTIEQKQNFVEYILHKFGHGGADKMTKENKPVEETTTETKVGETTEVEAPVVEETVEEKVEEPTPETTDEGVKEDTPEPVAEETKTE